MELAVPVLAGGALLAFASFVLLRLWRSVRRGLSIRMQVFVAMAAVSGAFAALLGLIAVERLELRATRLAAEAAQEDAELLARTLVATGRPLREVAPALVRANLAGVRPEGLRIEISDEAGRTVLVAGPVLPRGIARMAVLRAPDDPAGEPLGMIRVSRQSLSVRQILREVASRAAVLSLLLVIGTAIAAALVGRAIAKPIERLTQAASRIAQGERQAVLPRPFGREVRTLTDAVESMRRELEGRHLAERLAADLSHELKNPVAAIRASAEVLADGALEEPETAQRFVGRILEATQRLLGLVNNLLALTRLQARGVEPEPFDVADLAAMSADAHAAQADKRRVRIATTAPSGAIVLGDPSWLRRALDNLVDNALAFAVPDPDGPPEVRIAVQIEPQQEQIRVEVSNHGPGIAPEVQGRLFERFVTTRRDTGGSGLGLAIVAAVAEQHGGSVEIVSYGPPETRVRLSLPRAASPLHQIFP